ncbi:thiolase C-terminal domain-containing protein [Actinomadura madurae]|uniref:thiolase C-terminal domain-containing protein n=1 Tax=Actinomadura madurae TaxID=1993 RepID=UPI0020D1FDDF|nr:hypothetical protein [Actinomadura madurae]MCQ0013702.1 hypothetical protein [Actinomadura madurae]
MFPKDETAVVGIGSTPYYKRGASLPQTKIEMACKAILAACEDAGLSVEDVDGFAYYSGGSDTALIAQTLGIPEVRFTGTLTGGGGGAAGSVGLAAAAITSGHANVVVSLMTLQQVTGARFGAAFASKGAGPTPARSAPRWTSSRPTACSRPADVLVAGPAAHAPLRHASRGVRRGRDQHPRERDQPADRAVPRSDHVGRLYERADDLGSVVPVRLHAGERRRGRGHHHRGRPRAGPAQAAGLCGGAANGSAGRWGQAITWMGMPDEYFASSGHRTVARDVYARAGVAAADIDVALLYDHFTPMVVMQLEDYGFCEIGEGGPFVESGAIRWKTGSIPVNTHGGNLSEAYIIGMTHVKEAVEQLRGEAVNQVEDAELALVTGGPAPTPVSALILRK